MRVRLAEVKEILYFDKSDPTAYKRSVIRVWAKAWRLTHKNTNISGAFFDK